MARPRKERVEAEFKPVVSEMLAPALPADTQPIVTESKKVWKIGLSHLPDMEIEADSQGEAINAYNASMGITSTEHAYRVS
jgi:hypothetical protein